MKLAVLISTFLLPSLSLANTPSALRAVDGTDLSFFLKRYDGPIAILRRTSNGKRHAVPRTLQVPDHLPIRRATNGLVPRQQCLDAGYLPCPNLSTQCCPAGNICGSGFCCPAGDMACPTTCCPAGTADCCSNGGCCPTGFTCFTAVTNDVGCCPVGKICTTISGCVNPTDIDCPGDSFCCPAGTTCARDASGAAACTSGGSTVIVNSQNVNTALNPATLNSVTFDTSFNTATFNTNNLNSIAAVTNTKPSFPTTTSDNPLANLNPLKKSAAGPRAACASGLMATVAFLAVFFL